MKQVTIVVPNGNAILSSISGSFEILTVANDHWQQRGNKSRIEICIAGYVKEIKSETGFFSIYPTDLSEVGLTDLIIIPSFSFSTDYENLILNNKEIIKWISEQYKNGAEIASMCTGVFLLAATGLLNGKACSTHWKAATDFRRMFPGINLQVDKLIAIEHGIYTNGGAYSFLNLVLLLVEKFFDRQTAIYCSKVFQIEFKRTSQSQFFIFQIYKAHGDDLICQAQNYIEENLTEKISFEALSLKLAISRRSFDRRFIKATGNTPVEYQQKVKVEVAKRLLEEGRKTVLEIMYEVGYADDSAFREVFKKNTGLSPLDYRTKYSKDAILV